MGAARKKTSKKTQSPQSGNGQSTAIMTRDQRVGQVRHMLKLNKDEIVKALANQIDPDQFVRLCMTHFQRGDDKMVKADPRTFVAACVEAAQLGLKPDNALGECYLLPVWSKHAGGFVVDFRLGYPGLIKIIRRGGDVSDFAAECVFANDEFTVSLGTTRRIHHIPWYSRGKTEPGPIVAAYATAQLSDGTVAFKVVPKPMLDRRAVLSGDPRKKEVSNVWRAWPEAMSCKTAALDLCKWLPLPDNSKQAVRRDDHREAGVDGAIDTTATERIVQAAAPPSGSPTSLDDLASSHRGDMDQTPPSAEEDESQLPPDAPLPEDPPDA